MHCTVCGNQDFTPAVYRIEPRSAPALQCRSCGAVNLSEQVAGSPLERKAIRMASLVAVFSSCLMQHLSKLAFARSALTGCG
jgi:hypothetical protein